MKACDIAKLIAEPKNSDNVQYRNKIYYYTVFKKKFTLLLFAITKSDVDRFQ